MKRVAFALLCAVIAAGGGLAIGRAEDHPFKGRSDDGESLRKLPLPGETRASARTAQPLFAQRIGQASVYPASYGSGNLVNHGGSQIAHAGFFAVYWNPSIANSAGSQGYSTLRAQIAQFIQSFSDGLPYSSTDPSADYSVIQQYGTAATPISAVLQFTGDLVDGQPTKSSISDSQIRSYLVSLFNSGKVTPSSNTLFGVYLPSGMRVTMSGAASCTSFCGYHGRFSYSTLGAAYDIKYAAFPYLNCSGCKLPTLAVADMLTIVGSHEIREAVTDPDLNSWYDKGGYEADDKCAWSYLYQTTANFWVQPEYSNGGTVGGLAFPGPGCVVPR